VVVQVELTAHRDVHLHQTLAHSATCAATWDSRLFGRILRSVAYPQEPLK
jgi:hypothetical protein